MAIHHSGAHGHGFRASRVQQQGVATPYPMHAVPCSMPMPTTATFATIPGTAPAPPIRHTPWNCCHLTAWFSSVSSREGGTTWTSLVSARGVASGWGGTWVIWGWRLACSHTQPCWGIHANTAATRTCGHTLSPLAPTCVQVPRRHTDEANRTCPC